MITAPFAARAADYPDRPIRMVVPYPPGGVLDTSARIIGRKLSSLLGQQIVIENKPGASGTLGAATVVKADADGYTLLLTTGDLVTMPSLLPAATFDSNKDLLPIAMVGSAPMALVANVNAPFNNAKELVAAAKAAPGAISYGIPGIGTINHVAAEWFFHAAGVKLQAVPYRGRRRHSARHHRAIHGEIAGRGPQAQGHRPERQAAPVVPACVVADVRPKRL
jgi:tripartite-type tricarboxylate transporter receptor subunit TctC